ncbi:STAS domain-containing protein [Bacillus sp. HMF5848]|uniref:ATP-binding protein n=1 Tax=Bacillus sp. HMF5848 TaxID=2495421 RepID=UPI000F76B98F|nr:ATP-binding protein [Bacillus sp. HMF5848]RSK26840.1 STAS domain-containing protein [Bacillus sp. HMF5848]
MSQNGDHSDVYNKIRVSQLASIGQIAAGIAHEVRNPLTTVKGFLQLVKETNEDNYLDIALQELDTALLTMNNMLQVSKADQKTESYTTINMCSELESVLALFQNEIYRVTIHTYFYDKQIKVLGQRNALKKAFFNLIKNAFEAIPDKGSITISHEKQEDLLLITIQDTGVGIPKDKLNILGTPFFTTKDNGTGMGLTQVFSTLHNHGARVDVHSDLSQGTTFKIYFPIREQNTLGVNQLTDLSYENNQTFFDFISSNTEIFDKTIKDRTKSLLERVEDSPFNEDQLFEAAHTILSHLEADAEHELITIAKNFGEAWGKSDLPSIISLDWFHSLREVYSDFLYNFFRLQEQFDIEQIISLTKKTNYYLDLFVRHYHFSYTNYKNSVLISQREMIEELSVPIIPLANSIGILPIVGTMDTFRAKRLQEKTLREIETAKFQKIIIDLSGVAYMDTAVVSHLFRIIEGFKLLGCETIVTGIRSEIANTMIELGIILSDKVQIKADLQQSLQELNIIGNTI